MLYENCIEKNILIRPNKVALLYKDVKYTFSELSKGIEYYVNAYKNQGVSKNDRVVIYGKNSDIFVMQIFVCIRIGAIFIPVAENIPDDRLNYILANSNTKYIFNIKENKLIYNKDYNEKCLEVVKRQKKLGCIIYTSGSTALPKGVLESIDSMLFVSNRINEVIKNTEKDVILVGLPFSFDYGLYQIFLAYLSGATIVLLEEFGLIQKIPSYIQKYGITGLPVVPSVFTLLMKSKRMNDTNMKTVKYICSTGDVLPVELVKRFHEEFPNVNVIPMYGLTECKRVFIMPIGRWDKTLAGSCGKPLNSIHTELILENGDCAKAGQIGQLIVYGENVMEGYWDNRVETEKRFIMKDGQAGVKSGDYFYYDEDGFFYFCGRKEYYIKRRGIKVSPIEIENYFLKIEEVVQCVVLGYKHDVEGESVVAVVSVMPGSKLNNSKLRNYMENLPYEMRPTKIIVTEKDIPCTFNGKYDRLQLAKLLID